MNRSLAEGDLALVLVFACSVEARMASADPSGAGQDRNATAIPRGHAELPDQLRRAALSVPLNIAEGAGRAADADAARHFAIARGSAVECAAVLDVIRALGALHEEQHRRATELLARVVAMLTKPCR